MDEQIETQDSNLENAETQEASTVDWEAKTKELEAETAKWKRIAERNAKKAEAPKESKSEPETSDLAVKGFLRSAGISKEKEVDLAIETANKWGMSIDKLVDDEDFQAKLEKLRISEANALATTGVKGSGAGASQKDNPEYWISKGEPPTAEQVPDRKTRVKIARAMMNDAKNGKKFYNE